MRIAFIIVSLAAIAIGVVRIRTAENVCRNQMLMLQNRYEVEIPRQLQRQAVELSYLTSTRQVQDRAEEMALQLIEKDKKTGVAMGDNPNNPRPHRR